MYKRELDSKLASNTEIRAILLYGEDSFLVGYYGEKIAQEILKKDCEKNSFYFSEFDFNSAMACFSQGSLFGGESLVWIKADKKIPKKQLDLLIAALEKNGSGYLILEFYQAENKSAAEYSLDCKALAGSFKGKNIYEVRFFSLSAGEAFGILREYANGFELKISDFSLRKILEQQNYDLGLSVAELRKYTIFDSEINAENIENLGYSLGSVDYEEILELIFDRKPYNNLLEKFLEQGFEEIPLIAEIQKYFFQLFLFSSHIKLYGNATSEEVLGYKLPVNLLEKKKRRAIQIGQERFLKIFCVLNRWHEDSIRGITKGNGFLRTLIKIQAILE
ncbi:MAG: DNA polymerase III subunit delta [Helicobacter sp.]|uniref:DNA polymerase III subunit delta n=1 Tax=Helicobacter sp. TaxID=218 RepID=UPI0025862FC2|nr:DNA polymerase III subunit delta [Helicobacter sp.]MCI7766219.1 DNA polymerase III subunit delta [Helicobacter sp.]MDY4426667.1 DNA polymerase III subunit delta [Helicobacter sp.]